LHKELPIPPHPSGSFQGISSVRQGMHCPPNRAMEPEVFAALVETLEEIAAM
jgi:hypothetical protein